MPDVQIRTAAPSDAFAIEEVRVAVWKTAYRGLIADSFLDSLEADPDLRAKVMARGEATTLLAVSGGVAVGMAAYGPCRDEDRLAERELYALYVLTPGKGIGTQLLESCRFVTSLWVLDGNASAVGFYERHGLVLDGSTKDRWVGDEEFRELRMLRHLG